MAAVSSTSSTNSTQPAEEHQRPDVGGAGSSYDAQIAANNPGGQIEAAIGGKIQEDATPKAKDSTSQVAEGTLAAMADAANLKNRSANRNHIGDGKGRFLSNNEEYNSSAGSQGFSNSFSVKSEKDKEAEAMNEQQSQLADANSITGSLSGSSHSNAVSPLDSPSIDTQSGQKPKNT